MEKAKAKAMIKKQLWGWKYHLADTERIMPGMAYDLAVKVNIDSDKVYRLKILTGDENMLEELRKAKKGNKYDAIAVAGKKNKYAGGCQREFILTSHHQEVFK